MTTREERLDQYIDSLLEGSANESDGSDDPELRHLFQTVEQVRHSSAGEAIEWPEFDFAAEMSQTLAHQLNPAPSPLVAAGEVGDEVQSGISGPARAGSNHSDESNQGGLRWYSKQFAGMAAAALIVISFGIGLAVVLGDWGPEIHQPGAFVEEGELTGTILFAEYDGEQTISTIDADGTNKRELVSRPVPTADRAGFSWSPDGQWVAYVDPESGSRDAPTVISLVSADGSDTEMIDMEPVEGVMRLTAGLSWADDGNSLALVHTDPESGRNQIGILHRTTGDFQNIQAGEGQERSTDGHPAWAPDEWKLAYSRNDGDGRYSIHILHAGMDSGIPVVEDLARAIQPEWSPDGTQLAWTGPSEDGERGNIHVVDVDTGQYENITQHGNRSDYMPTWSSRDQIAFMSDHGDMHYDVFIVNPDGTELRNLTEEIEWSAQIPDWSEDGRYLTFTTESPDRDMWRINVFDLDEDRLYSVYESENPLYYAQWQPEQTDEHTSDIFDDSDISVTEPTDDLLELIRLQAEQYISDEHDLALTVNGQEVSAQQIESARAVSELTMINMQQIIEDEGGQSPEMALYNKAHIELVEEYGTENVGLAVTLQRAAITAFAEENGLIATEEQIEEAIERQRETHEMIEEHDPEAAAAIGQAQVDVIGEERFWEEYLPQALASALTETNVAEFVWEDADIEHDDPNTYLLNRDLYLAEFHAGLLENATIEIVDEQALEGVDLDRAIQYITEGYPAIQEDIYERRLELQGGNAARQSGSFTPVVPDEGLETETSVEHYMQELFERQGAPDAEILSIERLTYADLMEAIHGWGTPDRDEDDLIWRVETQGYIPGPMSYPEVADGEQIEPPVAENVVATLWVDPVNGLLPGFQHAQDTSQVQPDQQQVPGDLRLPDDVAAVEWLEDRLSRYEDLDYEVQSVGMLTVAEMDEQRARIPAISDDTGPVWRIEIFGDRVSIPGNCRFQGPECWEEQVTTVFWFRASDGFHLGSSNPGSEQEAIQPPG
jgi:Tol biopolymer transport system component